MEEFGYEKLKVWQDSMTLVDKVYEATSDFPKGELYCLLPQMRRAAISIPSNIAEDYGRGSKMFASQLCISLGSSFELRTQIEIALRRKYLAERDARLLKSTAAEISKMLVGLLKTLEK